MAKRIGLKRTQALIEGLQREIALQGTKFTGEKVAVKTLSSGETALTAEDSGKLMVITGGSATLPTAADSSGVRYTFLYKSAGVDRTITCNEENTMNGFVVSSMHPASGSGLVDHGVMTFSADGGTNPLVGTASYGDRANFVCDGVRWAVSAYCMSGSAITTEIAS